VLPLRRATDERSARNLDPARNRETFRAINEALGRGGAILIFPEGKTHDAPSLAPLKTGAARMAIDARDVGGARELAVVPIGLTFERKDAPRTRVLVKVGEPIVIDEWRPAPPLRPVEGLTAEIDARLRALTLNYASADDAARAAAMATVIAAVLGGNRPRTLADRPLSLEAGIARRISDLTADLAVASPALRARIDTRAKRLTAFQREARARHILLDDISISTRTRDGARFVLREGWIVAFAGPLALWGRLNHWLPFHAAAVLARRSIESAADPAMRTIVAGTALVLITYAAQGIAVGAMFGGLPAAIYLLSLPLAAEVNFFSTERLARALRRARAFLLFRRDSALRQRLVSELASLREETIAVDAELRAVLRPLPV
jgi:hypothetical protein